MHFVNYGFEFHSFVFFFSSILIEIMYFVLFISRVLTYPCRSSSLSMRHISLKCRSAFLLNFIKLNSSLICFTPTYHFMKYMIIDLFNFCFCCTILYKSIFYSLFQIRKNPSLCINPS